MLLVLNYTKNGCHLSDHEIEIELRKLINWMSAAPTTVEEGQVKDPAAAPKDYYPGAVFGEFNIENLYSEGKPEYEYEYSDKWQIDVSNMVSIDTLIALMFEGCIGHDEIKIMVDDSEVEIETWFEDHPYRTLLSRLMS
jgi:ABC-type oligopeptide transport system substrate-binding subunit